jgi:hypothetical protein
VEFVGIYGGLTIGLLGWLFGRQAAKKRRGLDEVHDYVWRKARSTSWYFTIAGIYVLLTLELMNVKLSLIAALAILLFIQLSSWGVAGMYYSVRLTEDAAPGKSIWKLSAVIGSTVLIFFVILSAVTGMWKFTLAAIPPVAVNLAISAYIANRVPQKDNKV